MQATGYQIVQELRRPSRRFWRKDVFFILALLGVGIAAGFAAERGVGPAPMTEGERPAFEAMQAPANDGAA
jgi:hypothetical protein